MNPFCPDALPWQPPALHPALVKIGTTWFEKLTGGTTAMSVTVTGTAAVASPSRTRTSALPVPPGRDHPLRRNRRDRRVAALVDHPAAVVAHPIVAGHARHEQLLHRIRAHQRHLGRHHPQRCRERRGTGLVPARRRGDDPQGKQKSGSISHQDDL